MPLWYNLAMETSRQKAAEIVAEYQAKKKVRDGDNPAEDFLELDITEAIEKALKTNHKEEKGFFETRDCSGNPLSLLKCSQCDSVSFYVGKGSYWTAVRCIDCNHEMTVHTG